MTDRERLSAGIRREARVVGLREFHAPSLEAVERRRLQLWVLTTILLVTVSLVVVALSVWPAITETTLLPTPILRIAIIVMSVAFCVYGLEKELHLHKLSRLLVDERVLSAALTNRLHEVSLLLDAGKAINSVLDLPLVLQTILRSAAELLGGASGSIMLVEGEDVVTECVLGNDEAQGKRVRLGEGIAGQVASSREPLLIEGEADAARFPGLTKRASKIESALSTPLISRDEVVGVLNVNAAPGRVFTEYDLRAMSVFAEQAAAAISNARLFEAERQHVSELVRLDQLKSQFVALVTHELRTPIASIIGAISIAQRPEMASERQEMDDIVQRQARRLDRMVEDLLAAAMLEQGDTREHDELVDAAALARIAATDAEVSGLEVEVEGPSSALVVGDAEWLRRIFDNLLDNAKKYGAAPVRIEIAAEQGAVVVTVLDGGPGVPEHERERVFERFQRLQGRGTQPGLGLGLPIVRGLVRSLGGEIWIGDAPGGGAAFRVSLPAAEQGRAAV
jgi:two-component system sensor histidine kinase KdpD